VIFIETKAETKMKEMMGVVGIILVLSSCCLSLLDAQEITHPTDGTVL